MDLQNIWHNYQPILCGCSKGLYTSTKGCIDPFSYCMMSSVRSTFCWLIFRLGGTGLGLTEEVEDVGDLHRGELLAVLAIPFASTSSWQFQGFAGTCLLPCLQLCLFPYLLPFLSGTCHPGGTGASWHQSQGLLSFLYRHQKTQKP